MNSCNTIQAYVEERDALKAILVRPRRRSSVFRLVSVEIVDLCHTAVELLPLVSVYTSVIMHYVALPLGYRQSNPSRKMRKTKLGGNTESAGQIYRRTYSVRRSHFVGRRHLMFLSSICYKDEFAKARLRELSIIG